MKELNIQEQKNVDFLRDKKIKFCLIQLTETGLSKSIFDATTLIREYLKSEQLHDFSLQNNGPEYKVVIKTHILTFARVIDTETSLYRAVTRGDERMWFGSAIIEVTKPDEIYAILAKDKELYLINISRMNIEAAWKSSAPNHIREFLQCKLSEQPEDTKKELLPPTVIDAAEQMPPHERGKSELTTNPTPPHISGAKYISASEAAEIASVTPETIRSLCKEKVIKFRHKAHMYFPCREDVILYSKSISQIHAIKKDIEQLEYELKGQREAIRLEYRKNKKYLAELRMSANRIFRLAEIVYALLQQYEKGQSPDFSERELELLLMMYRGTSFPDASTKMKLSNARARQIWNIILRKIATGKSLIDLKDDEIAKLQQTIQLKDEKLKVATKDPLREEMINNVDLYLTPLDTCKFSSRINRAFKFAKIYTVFDLVKCKRKELVGLRFIGRKSLTEVDDWLDTHGLDYGMIFPPAVEEFIEQQILKKQVSQISVK